MAACTQPGCTGTIVDGYCDVCGSPAGATPFAAVGASSPTAPAPTSLPSAAPRFVPAPAADDAATGAVLTPGGTTPPHPPGADSTRTSGSSRLGSMALGSFSSGALLVSFGWTTVNEVVFPVVLAATALLVWGALRGRRQIA